MESTEVLNKENIGKFLSKLVNAEQASYKTGKLAILRKKYRLAGLDHIIKKLEEAEADVVVDNGKWRVCNVLWSYSILNELKLIDWVLSKNLLTVYIFTLNTITK